MLLKKIEISGFKSFAHPTILNFKFPITAIVGPNGSGKSNVAEAFRFVLGEQSKKNMRSRNAEDLIWAGNNFKVRQNRARVAVYFDNSNKDFDIDFSELKIERVIFRDGANEYYINDSQVRLKDVQEILSSAKLGSSSHHIISQGEADAILNASDKDRFILFKEALGLNKHAVKLKDAKLKLVKTMDNIKEAKISLREIKPQLNFLEEQINKLQVIDTLKQELVEATASYIYLNQAKILAEKEKIKSELVKLKASYNSASMALDRFHLPVSDNAFRKFKNRLHELKNKQQSIFAELSTIKNKKSVLDGELTAIKRYANNSITNGKNKENEEILLSKKILSDIFDVISLFLEKKTFREDKLHKLKNTIAKILSKDIDSSISEKTKGFKKRIVEIGKEKQVLDIKIKELADNLEEVSLQIQNLEERLSKDENSQVSRESKLLQLSEQKNKALTLFKNKEKELFEKQQEEEKIRIMRKDASLNLGAPFLRVMQDVSSGNAKANKNYSLFELERIKLKLENLGTVDDSIISQYKELKEKYNFILSELEDLEKSKSNLLKLSSDLEEKIERETISGVDKIEREFNFFFKELFGGGSAKINLRKMSGEEKEEYNLAELNVSIPGKKLQSLSALSGGERSLVSIALVFAISQVSPPPFIILDETDAALDEANSKKYSDILLGLAQNSQIITITHNRQTMSVSGELFGVTMGQDAVSQVLSITLTEAESVAK